MQRRLFALMAALAPFSALAQTAPAEPQASPAPSPAPQQPQQQPHKKLVEKSWDELTHRQRQRLLHGFGSPQPSAEQARSRWDGMDARHRRSVVRAAARYRKQHA